MLVIMGVSAPHWVRKGTEKTLSLGSFDTFSLYNAFRYAALCAEKRIGFWANSNWADKKGRNDSILLMNYFENEVEEFKKRLKILQPNLLLIGTMSLSFPGAIAIAKIAKEMLGSNVFIVLGGKHVIESIFMRNGQVIHHPASPLRLMAEGKIPTLFDLIVSGDGEGIIFKIGEILGSLIKKGKSFTEFYNYVGSLLDAKGDYIAGWTYEKKIYTIKSRGIEINYDLLPFPTEIFGIMSNFPVFECDLTAHTYSDMSKGCIYDCYYCSERRSVCGSLKQVKTAPYRLFRQFKNVGEVAREEYGTNKVSAFVEDSILLGGINSALVKFNEILERENLNMKFGGSLIADMLLNSTKQKIISKLVKNGLNYIFWGIETSSEKIASKMNKNVTLGSWIEKNEMSIKFIKHLNIKCGISVLFGLGETQQERLHLLNCLKEWKETYGLPNVVSLNWAVQHPLQGRDNNANYTYIEWGTPKDSSYLNIFSELFGEASVKYSIQGIKFPSNEEFMEIKDIYLEINNYNTR